MLFERIVSRDAIDKGWSGDRKFCARLDDGSKVFLRIAHGNQLERKRREYISMCRAAELGIAMAAPLEFGICSEGVYSIQTWVEGEDAEGLVAAMGEPEQYRYGLDAGRTLRRLHTIPAPGDAPEWEERFNGKIDRKLSMYESCPLKYGDGEALLRYISGNRHLLAGRPQSWQHGDYHIGNMMIDREGRLVIIDFNREDYGDPWEEFNRIVWCAQSAPAFASGMVDGYFAGEIPEKFWRLLALYICSNTLSSLPWAIPFGEEEIQVMMRQEAQVVQWYDGMRSVVPTWYKAGLSNEEAGK